jgi:hypothetical protein
MHRSGRCRRDARRQLAHGRLALLDPANRRLVPANHAIRHPHTFVYLQRCAAISDSPTPSFATNADLVEATIETLCEARKYNLGYEGNILLRSRGGEHWDADVFKKFRYKRAHRRVAYAKEHALVHVAEQYRRVVDGVLREMLGGGYGKWAEMPEGQEVLEGVVL